MNRQRSLVTRQNNTIASHGLIPDYLKQFSQAADETTRSSTLADYHLRISPQTKRRQRADIALFEEFLNLPAQQNGYVTQVSGMATDLAQWSSIGYGLVNRFVSWQADKGYAVGSINVRLATIRTYCKLAKDAGYISADTLALIKDIPAFSGKKALNLDQQRAVTRKGDKKASWIVLTQEQLEKLIHDHKDTPAGKRDKLLMCLLIEFGLRCGEVARLTIDSLNLNVPELVVDRPKVALTNRFLLLDQKTKRPYNTLLAARSYLETQQRAASEPLFIRRLEQRKGTPKDRIDESTINARVKTIGKHVLGIDNLSPHDLRHNMTLGLFEKGNRIDRIQSFGGWSSSAMPLRYAEHMSYANEGVTLPSY